MNLIETKDRSYTVTLNGVSLHSKYSPTKEAIKFCEANITTSRTLIVIGAGLGYIYRVIEEYFPKIKVIGIPLSRELGDLSLKLNKTCRIQWDCSEDINRFLYSVIDISNIKGLQIIEWVPTGKVFPTVSDRVNSSILSVIRRLNGNILTTARFGKLWIKNSIKNYLKTNSYVESFTIDKPVVIVSAGYTLNNYFDLIKKVRDNIFLISLSSANMALEENNIMADLVFSTDPGYYSKIHIYGKEKILAMPFTNATNDNNTVLLINQDNFFENDLIRIDNLPHFNLNENGTVAGTALEFSIKYSNSKIILIGQDLDSNDLNSHVTPYSFDNLLKSSVNRCNPYYSIKYKRMIDSGITFQTYRDWFQSTSIKNPNRIVRVNNHSNKIDGIEDIDENHLLGIIKNNPLDNVTYKLWQPPIKKNRVHNIVTLLNKWIKSLENEEFTENPLFYLISTSNYTDVIDMALSRELRLKKIQECREESIKFIKGLLSLYERELLQQ